MINFSATAGNAYENTVFDITGTSSSITGFGLNGGFNFYRNKVYNTLTNSSSGVIIGISISGSGMKLYNNFVYGLKATASTNTNAVQGISVNSTTNTSFYYN